jgi:zinc protease
MNETIATMSSPASPRISPSPRGAADRAPLPWRFLALLLMVMLAGIRPAQAVLPIEQWTTRQGARVLFVRADAIPMLDVAVHFDAGGRHASPDRAGLASLTAALLDSGAGALDEDAFAERFARTGAQRSASAGADGTTVTLRTLVSERELGEAVRLTASMIGSPSFPQAALVREKDRLVARLRESATQPAAIAQRRFDELLFAGHPYGRSATVETVSAIEAEDLRAFHARNYAASRAVIAMIGAVTRERAEAIAETLLGDLGRGPSAPQPGTSEVALGASAPPPEALPPAPAPQVLRIAHPASQSHLLLGLRGVAYDDPDLLALQWANHVLGGGGFTSRLYAEVREKRGLAYSVYSYFAPRSQPGPFVIGLQTRKDQAERALEVVRETLERFVREGPTDEELAAARANLIGGFPLKLDSNRKILSQLTLIGVHRLPIDWLERWPERLAAISREDVMRALARHLDPSQLVTVIVGAPESRQ